MIGRTTSPLRRSRVAVCPQLDCYDKVHVAWDYVAVLELERWRRRLVDSRFVVFDSAWWLMRRDLCMVPKRCLLVWGEARLLLTMRCCCKSKELGLLWTILIAVLQNFMSKCTSQPRLAWWEVSGYSTAYLVKFHIHDTNIRYRIPHE